MKYHKIVCPKCGHDFIILDKSHILSAYAKCPVCKYEMDFHEIKRMKPASLIDLLLSKVYM